MYKNASCLCVFLWRMAATMHAKINRRKLDKLNIIKIWWVNETIHSVYNGTFESVDFSEFVWIIFCSEEILNPSVPMALRLSGILMGKALFEPLCLLQFLFSLLIDFSLSLSLLFSGGVVIVYERKVKLLYGKILLSILIQNCFQFLLRKLICVFCVFVFNVLLCTDDVTRLLVEMNKVWKVKAALAPDPTVLPKGKSHAKLVSEMLLCFFVCRRRVTYRRVLAWFMLPPS